VLQFRGGHFRVSCDPPQSDNLVEQGLIRRARGDEALRVMLEHIRALAAELDETERGEPRLSEALGGLT
jgi:hypothetical protein